MSKFLLTFFASLAPLCGPFPPNPSRAADPPAKYGPAATRLYAARDYVRQHDAPDFWALIPYYAPQQTDSSCSVASLTMLVNAARADQTLGRRDELATHAGLLRQVADEEWMRAVRDGGDGVTLDRLAELARSSLKAYGVDRCRVEVVHVTDRSDESRAKLRETLTRNEKSSRDFLLANFLQSEFTGDPEGAVGHIAPVGAYDAERRRVLILDPDRQWYEPYWVDEETFLDGMATKDPESGRSRGYVWVRVGEE